jgi:hypothetical protein
MKDAIEESQEGSIIHIKVKIGNRNRFPAGYDEWRRRIEIEIDEEPVKGKANKKLVEILAAYFNLEKRDVEIIHGKKSREKEILVKKKKDEILHILKNGLQGSAGGNRKGN